MTLIEVTIKDKTFKIDSYLKSNLDLLKTSVEYKWDMVGIVDGREGTAKSSLCKMMAYYMSEGNFSVKHIVFTADQFNDAVDRAKPKTAIVFDEMVMAGMSTDALGNIQKTLIKKFTLIRKKQLYIFLVIPYFYQLSKYFAIARSRFLIHCYSSDGIKRGNFIFYNENKKKSLYILHHKFWNYPKDINSLDFYGYFPDYTGMFIDEEEYEKKKDETIATLSDKTDIKKTIPSKSVAEIIMDINFSAILERNSSKYRLIQMYKKRLRDYYNTNKNENPINETKDFNLDIEELDDEI